jgi:aminoglycoside phosphotransferase (APT) family kinase protein
LKLVEGLGLAAPKPYLLDESGDRSGLVMEYVEGEMDFSPEDVDGYGRDIARQMAEQLARIHSVDLSGYDVSFLKRRGRACVEIGRTRPYLVDGMAAGLEVGRMEAILSEGPLGPGNPPGLLHGDFWAGNML